MSTVLFSAVEVAAAQARADRLKLTLIDAHEQLIECWRQADHEKLGYGPGPAGWAAYCAAVYGDLLFVRLAPEAMSAMAAAGMPQAAIAAPYAVSVGTVNARLRKARGATSGAGPDPALPKYRQVAEWVTRSGIKGVTIPQLCRRTGWSHGSVSGALSRAERAGLVHRPAALERRGNYRPYVAVEVAL